jgi:hypothetical protein
MDNIRNPEGFWINSQVFREEALHFMKNGYYCADPIDSPAWYDYWREQRKRCIYGHSAGGVKITGEHYFYLNFCPIQKVEDKNSFKTKKVKGFPDFWDGDYNYYWVRQIAKEGIFSSTTDENKTAILELDSMAQAVELKILFEKLQLEVKIEVDYLRGGYNLIVGKSRRKGYSYKSASIAACNFYTKPNSYTAFGAADKKYLYPKGIVTMSLDYINFINANTAFSMPSDVVNKQDHIRASYVEYINGLKVEKGFKSEIQGVTFGDNPDALRGKDAEDVFFEESGAFGTPGLLKNSYAATEDCVKAGALKTGMITIFGTSGDMTGGTADYAEMFNNPLAFDLLPFQDIWGVNTISNKVGFFHPTNWNMEGFYDEQGNSDFEGAKQVELNERKKLIEQGAVTTKIVKRLQERPLNPTEAFTYTSNNTYPVEKLNSQLQKVIAKKWHLTKGTPVKFKYVDGKVIAEPNLSKDVEPIHSINNIPIDLRGCPIIYEYPMVNPPKGLYKIGYDPIRQDKGTSLAGIIVYKSTFIGNMYHDIIVAEYVGRYDDPDEIDKIAEAFADIYNTTIMYENEVTGVKNYFRRIKRLNLLALQPDAVISKNVKSSKVARVYGCHMTDGLKDAGERYIKTWLEQVVDYDENDNPITTIDRIYSKRLLEELINYNRKGNFDLHSALIMCMFQVQQETLGKEHKEVEEHYNVKELLEMMSDMYKK